MLAPIVVGLEAVIRCPPDVLIDTMGCSFVYPIFKHLAWSKVCAYVHYPTISVDMLDMVASNVASYNNRPIIARNPWLSKLKLMHYKFFAICYRWTGKYADVVMVNSSWTRNHIRHIWSTDAAQTVFPPCNTLHLTKLPLTNRDPNAIVSMAQFRPEKNHRLQIVAMAKLVDRLRANKVRQMPQLIIIGGCRNAEDHQLVKDLQRLCEELKVEQFVRFEVNFPYSEMESVLQRASIAIHTMINEHFGISVVEFLSAGLLTLSHQSGGPKLDIIQDNVTGFFALTDTEFADKLYELIQLPESEAMRIRVKARESVSRFSEDTFEQNFLNQVQHLL